MASRKIEDLVPDLQPLAREFAARMAEAGVPFIFTCTRRTAAEQMELYARGRTTPGPKVTWTIRSRHVEGKAFDIAICKAGIPQWNVKADVDVDGVPDYLEAGRIGESIGLAWGGRWRSPDFPHFEIKEA